MLKSQLTPEPKLKIDLLIAIELVETEPKEILASLKASKINFSYEIVTIDSADLNSLVAKSYDFVLFYHNPTPSPRSLSSTFLLEWLKIITQNHSIPLIIVAEVLKENNFKQWQNLDRTKIISQDNLHCLSETIFNYIARDRFSQEKQLIKYPVSKQKKREKLIYQIGKKLNSNLEPEIVLEYIVSRIGETFSLDRVIICNLKANKIEIVREWRSHEKITALLAKTIPIGEDKITRTKPTVAEIDLLEAKIARATEDSELHSVGNLAILIRDEYYGSLILQKIDRDRIFTAEEIQSLQIIAELIAIAKLKIETKEYIEEIESQKVAALEADRLKSEFIAHISHELRNPLTAILGFARMLGEEIYGSLNNKQMQYIKAITASGNHLLDLINDLLDLSKIEADREELYLETVPIEAVCLTSMSIVQELAKQKALELKLEIEPGLKECSADRRRLKQILVNLLSNAVKFTEAGKIILQVKENSGSIEFSVIDTGIGIDAANLEKIFEPFVQIRNHLTKKYQGTGLGLPLSAKLARLHGGNLVVTSEKGQGSCFTLSLPK